MELIHIKISLSIAHANELYDFNYELQQLLQDICTDIAIGRVLRAMHQMQEKRTSSLCQLLWHREGGPQCLVLCCSAL